MAGEAPGGPTWETGGVMTPDEIRIKLRGVHPPELAEAVGADEITGRPPAQFVPRSGADGFTSHLVFDRFGVRYFDRTPRMAPNRPVITPEFALPWSQWWHVGLQIQRRPVSVRAILGPVDPNGFAARHPELEHLRNGSGLPPAFWAIELGHYEHSVDRTVLEPASNALRRFAGARYPGQVSVSA